MARAKATQTTTYGGPVRAGLETTVAALELAGEHAAALAAARVLADALDVDNTNAALWREYRATLTALTEAASGGDDDGTQAIQLTFRTPRVRG